MTITLSPVSRPVVRWFGGKWKLAPWIIAHFPPHRIYVEPFGGGASVLLRKPRAYSEVYNDLDGEIVNLFRVLRDEEQSARLINLLRLTPFAREEWRDAYEISDEPVEKARRLIVRAYMGFGANGHNVEASTGFRADTRRSGTTPSTDWANYPDRLSAAIDRVRGITIENRDALVVMRAQDGPEVLLFVDPPYVWSTRGRYSAQRRYVHEMDEAAHAELLAFLRELKGMVVLSGYPHPMYDAALRDWRRVERSAFADGARPRTEVLWLNPACVAGLSEASRQGNLLLAGPESGARSAHSRATP